MSMLGKILGGVGYALDTPGAVTRAGIANLSDMLRGEDRFQGYRATGRQMLDSMGVGGGYAGGLAADFLVDPLNLLAGAGLAKMAGRAAKGVRAARKGTTTLSSALTPSRGTAMALGAPTAGFGVMAMNEDQDPALNTLAAALMMSPLAVGAASRWSGWYGVIPVAWRPVLTHSCSWPHGSVVRVEEPLQKIQGSVIRRRFFRA